MGLPRKERDVMHNRRTESMVLNVSRDIAVKRFSDKSTVNDVFVYSDGMC